MNDRLHVDRRGWLRGALWRPSPNRDRRPSRAHVSLLVIHGISLPPGRFGGDAIEALFRNRLDPRADPAFPSLAGLRVSAHFLVRRSGRTLQFVSGDGRAWHAGASRWRDRTRCNDFSIGIELEGTDDIGYTAQQYRTLAALTVALARRYPIVDVAGHCHVAPLRKTDPGPAFDWGRYRRKVRARLPALRFPDDARRAVDAR